MPVYRNAQGTQESAAAGSRDIWQALAALATSDPKEGLGLDSKSPQSPKSKLKKRGKREMKHPCAAGGAEHRVRRALRYALRLRWHAAAASRQQKLHSAAETAESPPLSQSTSGRKRRWRRSASSEPSPTPLVDVLASRLVTSPDAQSPAYCELSTTTCM